MRNQIFVILLFSILPLCLTSCSNKKVEHFKLSVVITQDVGFNEGEPLNNGLKSLCNYYADTACSEVIYVPDISFIRTDYEPEKRESFSVPLSSLNSWRRSLNLLSATNLMEDYDEQIPNLKTPKILASKSGRSTEVRAVLNEYPSAKLVRLNDSLNHITSIREDICEELCKNSSSNFVIVFYQNHSHDSGFPPSGDYMKLYNDAKESILGPKHHVAFDILNQAAKAAIRLNQGHRFLDIIEDEAAEEKTSIANPMQRKAWRLVTSHPDDWDPVKNALMTNDSTKLEHEE